MTRASGRLCFFMIMLSTLSSQGSPHGGGKILHLKSSALFFTSRKLGGLYVSFDSFYLVPSLSDVWACPEDVL